MPIADLARRHFLLGGLAIVSSGSLASEDSFNRLRGKTLSFRFESGFEVEARYLDREQMRWRSAGQSGDEKIAVAQVAPDVLFISWVEDAGTTVSHVLDLQRQTVWSFVTFEGAAGREGRADRGVWRIVETSRQEDE